MVEVLISVLLLTVIFLAVSALHVGSHRFFLTAKDKAEVGYELQYAIEHIYEHVFVGISDSPAVSPIVLISPTKFTIRYLDKFDVAGSPKTCCYKIDNDELKFDSDDDGDFEESLGSKVDFIPSECEFSWVGTGNNHIFRIKLTAEFPLARADEPKQRLTLYSASYPRCASFN